MTFPSMNNDLLISMPSCRRVPSACVRFTRSLPARSTRCNLEDVFDRPSPPATSTRNDRIMCDRDECSFMFVAAVIRRRVPSLVNATTASMDETSRSDNPAIVTPPPLGASRTARAFGPSSSSHSISKSRTSSW